MGYEVHITRATEWIRSNEAPITEEDWLAVVDTDPELIVSADDYYDTKDRHTGAVRRVHAVSWTAHPEEPWPLWHDGDEILTKNADEPTIGKMKQLAQRLNARVLGDDGESY